MSLSDLASIGNFVSGIAVVVSLIYLALQVRHAHKAQRALMHQARTERLINACLGSMRGEVAEMVTKMANGEEMSSPLEKLQAYYYIRMQIVTVEDALWQHDAGYLDKDSVDTAILNLQRVMQLPAARAAWLMQRPQLPPAVRERMDKLLSASLAAETWDWAADYKDAQARALASH
ncbi:MAG: hypothetical protein JO056_08440 [Alphaproteobacteria bacterium]|nr:hypothetical protein [Alphaproteobacteria bacterium]